MANNALVLLSGGMDSVAAVGMSYKKYNLVKGLFFNYGQLSIEKEREYAKKVCKKYKMKFEEIELDFLKNTTSITGKGNLPTKDLFTEESASSVWVPARNLVFLSIASSIAEKEGIDIIVTGFNQTEGQTFPDNTEEFVKRFNSTLELGTLKDIYVESPTISMSKTDIAEVIIKNNDIENFWSCYQDGDFMCGKCESCQNVKKAFDALNKYDLISHRFTEG